MNTAEKLPLLPNIDQEATPSEVFEIGRDLSAGKIAIACSFGIENVVLLDNLKDYLDKVKIFAIDTGRLNEETYEVAESISMRYGITIDWYFPQSASVEDLERKKGLFSFRESFENRKECCFIRKVEPLQRALDGVAAWVTGMRREQCDTRAAQEALEIDQVNGGRLKINPLTYWTEKQVWEYAEKHRLPINRLHHQGYPSIGCAPCTRAIQPGEEHRAGRWWWEGSGHKECGLHCR
jgi:phosphoadenosine phosphosulfate reductase